MKITLPAWAQLAMFVPALTMPSLAFATNGYLQHGYGIKSQGQGGVGYALSEDTLAIATNPAAAFAVGDRIDGGLEWFSPARGSTISGNAFGPDQDFGGSTRHNFYIPQGGYSHRLGEHWAAAVAAYGNGGLDTDYASNPYARFGATGAAGVDLQQLFVTPTLNYAITPNQVIGVSLDLAYQLFKAKGIGVFSGFSQSPGKVSDNGYDNSTGAGVRLGWQGALTPWLKAGASWQSKTWMGRFKKYEGLFADGGSFDIPETYGLGLSARALPTLQVSTDIQRILYSKVPAVGDPVDSLFSGKPLGSSHGPGFGWRDITVYKVGVEYAVTPRLQVRGGYSHTRQPIPASQTFFNILAPGVIQDHYTIGATWKTTANSEVSFYALHAPAHTVEGNGSIPPGLPNQGGLGGGNVNIHLKEDAIGFSYGYRFSSRL